MDTSEYKDRDEYYTGLESSDIYGKTKIDALITLTKFLELENVSPDAK